MAIKIRLTRRGRKKKPFYRVVAANSEATHWNLLKHNNTAT
jgi:ribosomal protein S16